MRKPMPLADRPEAWALVWEFVRGERSMTPARWVALAIVAVLLADVYRVAGFAGLALATVAVLLLFAIAGAALATGPEEGRVVPGREPRR